MKLKNILFYIILMVFFFINGSVLGEFIRDYVITRVDLNVFNAIFLIALLIFIIMLAIYIQIIIHELGHLIFGLLIGYKFVSFRVADIMLIKNKNGFAIKRYFLAGTGGQCLLAPPERKADGSYSYKLYHLGGVILNLITAIIFLTIYFTFARSYFTLFALILGSVGILFAYMNGVPMSSAVANDAQNLKSISKDKDAMDAMWKQLKINSLLANDIGLDEMPKELFEMPQYSDKHNVIISAVDIFKANRLLVQFEFAKTYDLINELLSNEYTILPIYIFLLQIDKLTIELMRDKENTDISILEDKDFKVYRKAMSKFLSNLRLEYAIRQLKYGEDVFEEYKVKMLKIGESYPYSKDVESELGLMEKIRESK